MSRCALPPAHLSFNVDCSMVAYLKIGCRCPDDQIVGQFTSLCSRLNRAGKIDLCQVYDGVSQNDPLVIRGEGLFRFLAERQDTYNSKQRVKVQFDIPLPSRDTLTIYAELNGRLCHGGFNALADSPIVLAFEQRDLLGEHGRGCGKACLKE